MANMIVRAEMDRARIRSVGDLEVVLIHESHEALATIIDSRLYTVLGAAPDQQVSFQNDLFFDLFLIQTVELFVKGKSIRFDDETQMTLSLVDGLKWLCETYPVEVAQCSLADALQTLMAWIDTEVEFSFWSPDIDAQVEFPLSRRDLIWFGANCAKHNILRLSAVLERLDRRLKRADIEITADNTIAVLDALNDEVRARLLYHATYLIELLGNMFVGLNRLVWARYSANPTNRVLEMTMPPGVTSDVFRNLYSNVLVFKRYDESARISPLVPTTWRFLKLRY